MGYRASGKTTIAQSLSDQFDCPAIDADDVFEQMYSCSIGEFIENQGEMSFRDAETVVLKQLLRLPDGVLSTGGGIVLREENRRMIEAAGLPVVWLMAPADEIRRRLASDTTTARRRPALKEKMYILRLIRHWLIASHFTDQWLIFVLIQRGQLFQLLWKKLQGGWLRGKVPHRVLVTHQRGLIHEWWH